LLGFLECRSGRARAHPTDDSQLHGEHLLHPLGALR
jgi:hypothetical protein